MADQVVVGFEIHVESDDAARLVECAVRRLSGNDDATPDTAAGILQVVVQAERGVDVPGIAEQQVNACADELGIADSWQLVSVLRP